MPQHICLRKACDELAVWCAVIYTEAGDPSNTFCRTDNSNVLDTTPWIRVPYPGQWGAPTFKCVSYMAVVLRTRQSAWW